MLRFGSGFTTRANSALATGYTGRDVSRSVAIAEHYYLARGVPPAFQLGPDTDPSDLPRVLEERGYTTIGHARMWTASIDDLLEHLADPGPIARRSGRQVRLRDRPDASWRSAWLRLAGIGVSGEHGAASVLASVPAPARFTSAMLSDRRIVGTALGVVQEGQLGIFCVASAPELRRTGIASAMLRELVSWAAKIGARGAYLHVTPENAAARSLYQGIGFSQRYSFRFVSRDRRA